ncbi:hypothetical protein [Streptomyces sp. NPDC008001]|uniref:hypothetical protein n=1 Tax=Streptomyces sp. NPDC008001 TaxID=3364804 RepID=UPI0036DFDF59
MRRTTVRRTALAACAASLALLMSACGGSDSSGKSDAKDQPEGAASPSAPAQSAAPGGAKGDLGKRLLAQGDVPGYRISEFPAADLAAGKTLAGDKAECKPLVDAMALRGTGTPAETASRKLMALPKGPAVGTDAPAEDRTKAALKGFGTTITADTLGSYTGQGATEALAALKKAGADCAGGFTMGAGSDKTQFKKITPAEYSAGDEAVAFDLDMAVDGDSTNTTHLAAVRKGSTIAVFYSLSLTGQAELPKAAIDAQVKKLG